MIEKSHHSVPTALAVVLVFSTVPAQREDPAPRPGTSTRRVEPGDWPQWRGPDRDGVSKERGWVVEGKEQNLWSTNVGTGYSTVSIAAGRLYTMGHDKERAEDTVYCLGALDGSKIWQHSFPAKTLAKYHIGGTLATPSVDGDRVYVSNRWGKMFCFDAETGKVEWSKDLQQEYGVKVPTWGLAASPLVLDDMIVMNVGHVIALKRNGASLWRTRDYGHCYSTPVDMKLGKRKCLAVFSSKGLTVLDRKSGKQVTRTFPWKTKYDVNAATPVVIGDRIFISSGYGHGCAMLQVKGKKLEPSWESKVMRTQMSGAVLYEDHLYGFDDATLRCIDLAGKEKWSKRGLGKGALVIAGGRLVIMGQRGDLVIAAATPDGFQGLARTRVVSGGVCWTTPVVAGGLIYCRNSLGDLVCRDHRGDAK